MPAPNIPSNPLRYIQRIDKEHHTWKVSIRRATQLVHRYFTDSVYGGPVQALAAAMAWRDTTVAELTGVDYGLWRRDLNRPNNTSGIVGVYRGVMRSKRGKQVRKQAYWCGYWQNTNGKRSSRSFSINKYGEEGAKQLAIRARQEGMADVARQLRAAQVQLVAQSRL